MCLCPFPVAVEGKNICLPTHVISTFNEMAMLQTYTEFTVNFDSTIVGDVFLIHETDLNLNDSCFPNDGRGSILIQTESESDTNFVELARKNLIIRYGDMDVTVRFCKCFLIISRSMLTHNHFLLHTPL